MKALVILAALGTAAFALPAVKVTNREFGDGTASSKSVDPEKKRAIETVYKNKVISYKIVYALDDRLQPLSGVFYNPAGRIFQKSVYKLDGADRIAREIVYTPQNKLVCTKDYTYGVVKGKETVIAIDTYDANGVPQGTAARKKR